MPRILGALTVLLTSLAIVSSALAAPDGQSPGAFGHHPRPKKARGIKGAKQAGAKQDKADSEKQTAQPGAAGTAASVARTLMNDGATKQSAAAPTSGKSRTDSGPTVSSLTATPAALTTPKASAPAAASVPASAPATASNPASAPAAVSVPSLPTVSVPTLSSPTTTTPAASTTTPAPTASTTTPAPAASTTTPAPAASTTTPAPAASTTTPAPTASTTTPAATSPTEASSSPASATSAPVLGTFDISTAAQASAWKSAGGNAIIIPVYWQQAQVSQGGAVSLASAGNSGDNVTSEIQMAHQDGLAVYLEFDLQYPPSWVLSSVPQYVDQGGTSWSQPTNPGADVRDWVWTAVGRQAVSSFIGGALADLQPVLSDVAGIRAGGGVYGELDFPNDGSTVNGEPSFWGYDAAAQQGVGLASGESACPLPGYVYGSGTAAQDAEWANWYLGSLASWISWYTQLLQTDGWSGPTYVLSPSSGMRTNFTPRSTAYEQQLAYGTDWGVMMDSYDKVANVWPWSTWADDTEPYWHTGDTVDSDAAAWRKLLELAQARGLATQIMGENTGGGGAPAIHQLMSGALASGYAGVFYLDYPTLTETGLTSYLVSQFHQYAQ
jgi:hypothetical protein